MEYKPNRAWAEINLDNLAHNVREIRRITDKKAEIMGVVKADAYGHGTAGIMQTLMDNGVTSFAVAILDEAVQLRKTGIEAPILVLNHTDPARSGEIVSLGITQTVFSHELAEALSAAALKLGCKAKIHIKIDTGMTRIGFMPDENAIKSIMEISRLPGIEIEGIFTHFASADEADKSYTYMQFEKFMDVCRRLSREGIDIPVKHVANSAAIIQFPEMHLDMVRPGIILYGMYPSDEVDKSKTDLKPAMALKSQVVLVKTVKAGTCISYGRRFTTKKKSRIATVSIGYADGYTRLLSNRGKVLINGEEAPVVGRICMDQCMVDVTDIDADIRVGDEVVLFGRQGQMEIKAEDIAETIGTICYEVVCAVGRRVPRVYLKNGEISMVTNYLA